MTLSSGPTPYRDAVGKFFRRMLPLLVLMLVINQMDRTNIGFVRHHLEADLGIGAAAYGLGAGLFFVSYAIFEVPSNILMKRFGARVWLTRIMISWGLVIIALAFTTDTAMFYVLRFLLGIAEAGFFPGVMYYFTQWLPNAERGRASALFLGGSATAYIITGPISGSLLQLDGLGGLAGWKWMFLLEGGISVLVGITAALFLVSRVEDAKWLTARERAALREAIDADERERDRVPTSRRGSLKLLLHPQMLLLCWTFFAMTMTGYSLTFWLPSLVDRIDGLSDFGVGLVSAIPWICAVIAMYALAKVTDRTGIRRPWVLVGLVLGAVGTSLATVGSPWFGLVALCLAAVGFKCSASAFWPMTQHAIDLKASAAGIAMINALGNLGGFAGPSALGLFEQFTGSTHGGLYLLAGISVLAALTVSLIRPQVSRSEPSAVATETANL